MCLFIEDNIAIAFDVILVIKIASAGFTMFYFLNRNQEPKWTNLIFSTCYALSTYIMIYGFNIMWLDSVILLPIVIAGLDDLIRCKKPILYTIILSIILITNYYMGFMVCMFSFIYFIYKLIIEDPKSSKEFFKIIKMFIIFSVISVLIACIILIPAYIGISGGRASFGLSDFRFDTNFKIKDILDKFLPFSFEMRDIGNIGLPPIFCGSIINILVICFFLNKKIKLREKIATIGVFLIFFLSFYIVKFNLVWTLRKCSSILVI